MSSTNDEMQALGLSYSSNLSTEYSVVFFCGRERASARCASVPVCVTRERGREREREREGERERERKRESMVSERGDAQRERERERDSRSRAHHYRIRKRTSERSQFNTMLNLRLQHPMQSLKLGGELRVIALCDKRASVSFEKS